MAKPHLTDVMATSASTPVDERPPGITRRRFWLLVAVVILGVVATAVAAVYYGYVRDVPLEVSPETTVITEPLMPDGRVDYFAAAEQMIYPPELATDDNGYRTIVAALGASPKDTPEERHQLYEKLGLDPEIAPALTYEDPEVSIMRHVDAEEAAGRAPDRYDLESDLWERLERPWTTADLPMLATWPADNAAALDLVSEAVRRPVFCIPRIRASEDTPLSKSSTSDISALRDYADGLSARARFRMAGGDIDGAIDDIITCARLGRHLEQNGSTIEHAIGFACEAKAYSIGPGSFLEHQPTEEQWRRFLDELNELPARDPASVPLEIERLGLLDGMQALAMHGDLSELTQLDFALRDLREVLEERDFGLDWNIITHHVNENYDSMLRGTQIPGPLPEDVKQFMSRARRSQLVSDMLASQYQPAIEQFFEIGHRTDCKVNMLRIVLAMLLYEKRHGTLPPAYSVDEQGNPLHSWRVLLLPYLGYDELYSQLRLDEPWDSPHNQAFHAADVPVYQCSSASLDPGMTEYSVVEGETCAFFGGEGKRLDAFGEHSADMILVVERIDPVCWMNPASELTFAEACLGINREGAVSGLGSHHVSGMHVGLRSGAIRFISQLIDRLEIPSLFEGTKYEPSAW